MTNEDDVDLITFGDANIEFLAEDVEEVIMKKMSLIPRATSTNNYGLGAKDTLVLDLLMVEHRFTIKGYISKTNRPLLRNLVTAGGTFKMVWDGTNYVINCEKISIKKSARNGVQPERYVMMTVVVGVDI